MHSKRKRAGVHKNSRFKMSLITFLIAARKASLTPTTMIGRTVSLRSGRSNPRGVELRTLCAYAVWILLLLLIYFIIELPYCGCSVNTSIKGDVKKKAFIGGTCRIPQLRGRWLRHVGHWCRRWQRQTCPSCG